MIHHGDCLEVLRTMPDNSVDAVVTDPPYGLSFMGKKWDYDVPSVEIWAECLRVLKPGGHLLAFAGTRTQHRMAVRIEDAGFEIRDMIAWVYSSGFPKSFNLDRKRGEDFCGCERTSEQKSECVMRPMRNDDVSKAVNSSQKCGEVLQSGLQKQGSPATGRQELPAAEIRGEQSGMEGRGYAQAPEGELQGSEVCPSAGVGFANGEKGRVHYGTPPCYGEDVRVSSDKNGGCGSPGSQSIEQSPIESSPVPDQRRPQAWRGWAVCSGCGKPIIPGGFGTALKPALEPITVARKPLGTCATNVLQMVESQLRERGVRGEILWKPENASGAARSKKTTSSGSTRPSEQSGTSAKTADESAMQSAEQQSLKSSGQLGTNGQNQTPDGSASFQGCTTSAFENPSSLLTAASANAAESVSATSSPLTTSTAEGHGTGSKFTGRFTLNCGAKDSRPDTESFAGIATGLTGSMGTVHISRDSEGFFLWPKGLPEFVPGSPLTVAENVLAHGTGGLNIDGCRVNPGEKVSGGGSGRVGNFAGKSESGAALSNHKQESHNAGRWPANLIHDGGEPAEMLGDAARFFYCAKASKRDRDEGLDGFAKDTTDDGRDTPIDNPYLRGKTERHNIHPTVKPTDLMRYLCRLVTPPNGIVLDPFTGSGSTGKAAVLEGFQFIGIEREAEYVEIAKARIEAAMPQQRMFA